MEIVQERIEREFGITVITTVPNVGYIVTRTDGEVINVHNPRARVQRCRRGR